MTRLLLAGALLLIFAKLSAQTYTQSSIAYSWDDITSSGGAVSTTSADDDGFDLALPFNFEFFGNTYSSCYVNTNGLLVFGSTSTSFSNLNIPNASSPSDIVAGYWDDLYFDYGCAPTYWKYHTLGTAPFRYFVISWISFRSYSGACGEYVTFQIKLFESTNNIEVHVQSNGLATNNSATIGIENSTGTAGYQAIYNTNPGNAVAWRWTYSAPPIVPGSINFDVATDQGFSHNGLWQRGTPTTNPPVAARSGANCWATNLTGNYPNNANNTLVSCIFKVTSQPVNVSFYECVRAQPAADYCTPMYSINQSAWYSGSGAPYSANSGANWSNRAFGISSSMVAVGDRLELAWNLTSSPSSVYLGWYIDDLDISGVEIPVPECVDAAYPQDGDNTVPLNVTLTWLDDNALFHRGYKVYFGTNNPPTNIINGTIVTDVDNYVLPVLTANTTYYWKIVPYNAEDASGCPVWSFSTYNPNYWTGATSTAWTTGTNWSLGHTPTSAEDAVIPYRMNVAGQWRPVVDNSASQCRHLYLDKGASLNNSSNTLNVYGNWLDNAATFTGSTGTVQFNGTLNAKVEAFANPYFMINNIYNTGSTTIDDAANPGDDRGGIAVTPTYVYVTGDTRTTRYNASNMSFSANTGFRRDGLFSDLLTGTVWTLWNTTSGTDPAWPATDGDYTVLTYTCNSIRDLNADLSLGSTIIPLIDENGNAFSFVAKGGQTSSYIYRTGLFSGYGFLVIFADASSPDEKWYVIDIPSGVVKPLCYKNITPDIQLSESWAIWGIGEYDGTNYYAIMKYETTDNYLVRVNLSDASYELIGDYPGTGLGEMATFTYSPWAKRMYFHHENNSLFRSGAEVHGFVGGTHSITRPEKTLETFNHFTVNKNAGNSVTLQVPIKVNNATLTSGILDVNNTENNKIFVTGNWTNNATFTQRQGEVEFCGTTAQFAKGSAITNFFDMRKKSSVDLTIGDASAASAEIIVNSSFSWEDYNDRLLVGTTFTSTFDIPEMYISEGCTYQSTSTGTLQVKKNFTQEGSFVHGTGTVEFDGSNLSNVRKVTSVSVWSNNCNAAAGWTLANWACVVPNGAAGGPVADHTGSGGGCFITNGNSAYANTTTHTLTSPAINLSAYTKCQLTFWMQMNAEGITSFWDGGFIEVYNGVWTQVPNQYLNIDYNGTLSGAYSNPLAGFQAWSFDQTVWVKILVDLPVAYNVANFQFRYRFGSDASNSGETGWSIDDCEITGMLPNPVGNINFGNLTVNKSGNQMTLLQIDIDVDNNLTINAGELNPNIPPAKSISVGGHWLNNGGFYTANNNTVTFDGPAAANVNVRESDFYNVVLNKAAGITLITNDANISNVLTLTNGRLSTGARMLTIESAGTAGMAAYSTSSYINGNLRRRMNTGWFTENFYSLGYGTGQTTVNGCRGSVLNVTSTGVDPMILMETAVQSGPGVYNPVTYPYVQVRYRVTGGTASGFELFWCTPATPWARGGFSVYTALVSDGAWHIVNVNLNTAVQATTDAGMNITGWRFDWCVASGVTMDIDYIKVVGPTTTEYDFPVGSSANYELAKVKLNASSGISFMDASFSLFGGVYGNIQPGLEIGGTPITTMLDYGYWVIAPESGTSTNYDVTCTSRGHTNGGSLATQHTLLKRANAGDNWNSHGTHNNGTQSGTGVSPITAKRTAINGFSHFAIARSDNNPLPVELVNFNAECGGEGVLLTWNTYSEINNDGFYIQKSSNGNDFSTIGRVEGNGTTSVMSSYTFTDGAVNGNTAYYRLVQVDYDGRETSSDIVTATCTGNESPLDDAVIYANSQNELVISFKGVPGQVYTLHLIDQTGKVVLNQEQLCDNINNTIVLPRNKYSAGLYSVVISDNEHLVSKQVLVKE